MANAGPGTNGGPPRALTYIFQSDHAQLAALPAGSPCGNITYVLMIGLIAADLTVPMQALSSSCAQPQHPG